MDSRLPFFCETDYIVYELESGKYYITFPGEYTEDIIFMKVYKPIKVDSRLGAPSSSSTMNNLLIQYIKSKGISNIRNYKYNDITLKFGQWKELTMMIEDLTEYRGCIQCGLDNHIYIDCIYNRYKYSKCYICYRSDHIYNECNYTQDMDFVYITDRSVCSTCGKSSHTVLRCSEKYNIFGKRMKRNAYSMVVGRMKTLKSKFNLN